MLPPTDESVVVGFLATAAFACAAAPVLVDVVDVPAELDVE